MKSSATKNLLVLRAAAAAVLVVSFIVGFAASASAHSTGVVGASGMDQGFFCRNCHVGGTVPTVAFDGPTTLAPGSTGTFTFTVTSHSASQIAAGLDVAASGGSLDVVAGQGTQLLTGEVTHSSPRANDANGQAIFEFIWQAPTSAGNYILFGAGASVNGNLLQTGDAAARATYEVVVGVPTPTPTPNGTCVGDCGSDGNVTVDEVITGVDIALGAMPLSVCSVFDMNNDGEVTVDEILQAVNGALNGCPK